MDELIAWLPSGYFRWLLAVSLGFALLERVLPERDHQSSLRRGSVTDLAHLLWNGHFFAVVTGGLMLDAATWTLDGLGHFGLRPENPLLNGRPAALQFMVFLVVGDFLQWCVHNLLHRVPLLWRFHQVHHSVTTMDWAGNFRFHWMELVVYKSLLYVPMWVVLGGDPHALFPVFVFTTAWGHFNHSNLRMSLGPLAYVFNSPRMHLWHHDASSEGGPAKNFGIVFSCWDYLFRTAYWPRERPPDEIGFPGIEAMPEDFCRQLAWPLWKRR